MIEDTIELSSSLKCLAWIGDDHVVAKFTEWQNLTLRWLPNAAQLARDPSIAGDSSTRPLTNTTREAGWELTSDGRRRDLYVPHWRKLILARSPGAQSTPVSVGGLMEALCPWCERDLAAIFDLDLRAPELAFLGLTGERLRIPVCRWCSYGGGNGPLFWREDTSGNARWSEANGERPAQGAQYDTSREYEPPWSVVQYILGPEHADPYTSLVPEGDFDPNRLGGLPAWVQYPDHPICIDCGRSLRFLGQLDADEHGGWEGLIYVFLCAECQVAATLHQQT